MKKNILKKKTYITPKVEIEEIKTNFFYSNNRFQDSLDDLLNIGVYAQSGGCGGSSSSKADVCFLPETKITLYDGTRKRIDQIIKGDELLSYSPDLHKVHKSLVLDIEHHTRPDGYYVINNLLKVTNDHPIWVNDNWVKVDEIKISDILHEESGKNVRVKTIEYIEEEVLVYNIKAEMSYFAEGILVNSYWKE